MNFKMPGSVNPIEWALRLALFTSYQIVLTVGGREQLFTGGTNTWDSTGLVVEIWADYDAGVAGSFHLVEEFEKIIPVLQTQSDLQIVLERGFSHTHLLFIAQTANAKDNTLVNSVTVQSAGRVWTPQGDKNAPLIQNWNRASHVNNPAENSAGNYFMPLLRYGIAYRVPLASVARLSGKIHLHFA